MRYSLGVAVFVKVVVQCISTVPVETSKCAIHVHVVWVWQCLLRSWCSALTQYQWRLVRVLYMYM